MFTATLRVFNENPSTSIDPRIYGSFIEHLGRAVYTGIYEPGHPTADAKGLRQDTIDLVKELDVPIVRYPGGNFVSCYNWEDGVGPRDQRPRRLDLAWRTVESNQFGTDEFMDWCQAANTEPMMAVNLGTRGIEAARNLAEYCNHPGGTAWSDLRRKHGWEKPHNVKVWCLGNEMDGPWQTGRKTAYEYGRLANEAAGALRQFDPKLELVVCGSSYRQIPTWMDWERVVLEETYDRVDFLSLHAYFAETGLTDDAYLALPARMDLQIRETIAACDFVQAKLKSRKVMKLSFDEWNVWDVKRHRTDFPDWAEAPGQLEQVYTMKDALVVGGLLLTLLRHASRVRMACMAQLVNVIAPIMTAPSGAAWRQTIYHPYAQASRHGRGSLLHTFAQGPIDESPEWGPVARLDTIATRDGDSVTIFALNRSAETCAFEAVLDSGAWELLEHSTLHDENLERTNTAEAPEAVRPRPAQGSALQGRALTAKLPGRSWNMLRLKCVAKS